MTLPTGAARRLVERDPARALAILQAVEDGGRAPLNELRDLLGLLTSDEEAPLAPQPGIGERHCAPPTGTSSSSRASPTMPLPLKATVRVASHAAVVTRG
jgi:hypothetical protein